MFAASLETGFYNMGIYSHTTLSIPGQYRYYLEYDLKKI